MLGMNLTTEIWFEYLHDSSVLNDKKRKEKKLSLNLLTTFFFFFFSLVFLAVDTRYFNSV